LVTSPDYTYDVCMAGICVSPGACGDSTCNVSGPHFPLPDTDQRTCYDGTVPTACPGLPGGATCASIPFCGQDAQYGWDTTNPESARFSRAAGAEPTVTDNVTALMWQGCVRGRSDASCTTGTATARTWLQSLGDCEGLVWAGASDWRLPDPYELLSLVDFGVSEPAISVAAFPETPATWSWTSSSYAGGPSLAWVVDFCGGHVNRAAKIETASVRCVRGGPGATPAGPRYVRTEPVAGQPVVSDAFTGLAWQGCPSGLSGPACAIGTVTISAWQEVLAYCESSSWAGYSDWRLPNNLELFSLSDQRRCPAVDAATFPATYGEAYWTSTSYVGASAWQVLSGDGYLGYGLKTDWRPARCVRSGP
jgi:hypothetical protein